MFLVLALSVSLLITHCSKAWIQSKRGCDYTEDADGFWQKNIFEFGQYSYEVYVLLYNKRRHYRVDGHPEHVSESVRGEWQEKAHDEMLKFAIEREQRQACLNYAERKQIEQS